MLRLLNKLAARVRAGLAAILLAAGCILAVTSVAQGQGPPGVCHPRDHLLNWLRDNFGEVPVGFGLADGKVLELLASKDGLTWTIIMTWPNGRSCVMTGGEAWRRLPLPPKGPAV
ncbi:hypothetical protein [Pelagibius marinus]|uniref:hypothetical protein n=1 Tax=Pelagibius marinus TaxID=2762760 RepID=UPI0018732E7A|nr:hypothetical protein [Pelagibius marinus]